MEIVMAVIVGIFAVIGAVISWIFTFEHFVCIMLVLIFVAVCNKGNQITVAIWDLKNRQ